MKRNNLNQESRKQQISEVNFVLQESPEEKEKVVQSVEGARQKLRLRMHRPEENKTEETQKVG